MNVKFTDNSKEVLAAMQKAAVRALEKTLGVNFEM